MWKVLYYTNENVEQSEIQDSLEKKGFSVTRMVTRPTLEKGVEKFNLLVSDRSRYIIPKDVIEHFSGYAINLHPSLLPHNRGDQPLLWAAVEGRPFGVTIHQVSERFDEGAILSQTLVSLSSALSLRQAYSVTRTHMVSLFEAALKTGLIPDGLSQSGHLTPNILELGSSRSREQGRKAVALLPNGWDTTIDHLQRNAEMFLEL